MRSDVDDDNDDDDNDDDNDGEKRKRETRQQLNSAGSIMAVLRGTDIFSSFARCINQDYGGRGSPWRRPFNRREFSLLVDGARNTYINRIRATKVRLIGRGGDEKEENPGKARRADPLFGEVAHCSISRSSPGGLPRHNGPMHCSFAYAIVSACLCTGRSSTNLGSSTAVTGGT